MLSCTAVSSCQPVSHVDSETVEHMYDIWVSDNNDILVYSDWKDKSVNMLSLTTGTLLKPLASGLMRPSQLLFVGTQTGSSTSYSSCATAIYFVLTIVNSALSNTRRFGGAVQNRLMQHNSK